MSQLRRSCAEISQLTDARLPRSMKFDLKKLFIVVSLAAVLFAVPGILHVLYYAQYNAVVSRLEAVSGLTITSSWKHEDMSLEDCGFTVESSGANARLVFWDGQDWRGLFRYVDGICFEHQNSRRMISCEELHAAGIDAENLTELLEQLPEVLDYCEKLHRTSKATDEDSTQASDRKWWVTMRPDGE